MKRFELLGRELIRHENACSDIKAFCTFLESRRVETGKQFLLPDSGGDLVYCLMIDYDNLLVRYSYKNKKICTELDLFYVPQKTLNETI